MAGRKNVFLRYYLPRAAFITGGFSKTVNKIVKQIENKIGGLQDYEQRDNVVHKMFLSSLLLRAFLSVHDSFRKAFKVKETSDKLKDNPNIKIKNLDGHVSLAYKTYQLFLSVLQTISLTALTAVSITIALSPQGAAASLILLGQYLTLATLGFKAAINFHNFSKSGLKFLNLKHEEKEMKDFFEEHNVAFESLIKTLINPKLKGEKFEFELSNHQTLKEEDLTKFFDQRFEYLKLKTQLFKLKIDPKKVAQLKENEPLSKILQQQLERTNGKIDEKTLYKFSKMTMSYEKNKEALQKKLGEDLDLKTLIQGVDNRQDHLKTKSVNKGIMMLLAFMGLIVFAMPSLYLISVPIVATLWCWRLIPPLLQNKRLESMEPESEIKLNENQIIVELGKKTKEPIKVKVPQLNRRERELAEIKLLGMCEDQLFFKPENRGNAPVDLLSSDENIKLIINKKM